MNRRSLETNGYVKFPTDSLPSSNEGGMFVRLVVVDKFFLGDNNTKKWILCSGGWQSFIYDEVYIGDDKPLSAAKGEGNEEQFHFPALFEDDGLDARNFLSYESIPYLCVLTLGSTGWSNSKWLCTYDDLTENGKRLYNLLQELYDGCELVLQTWLDT